MKAASATKATETGAATDAHDEIKTKPGNTAEVNTWTLVSLRRKKSTARSAVASIAKGEATAANFKAATALSHEGANPDNNGTPAWKAHSSATVARSSNTEAAATSDAIISWKTKARTVEC